MVAIDDAAYLRQLFHLKPAPEFEQWLEQMKISGQDGQLLPVNDTSATGTWKDSYPYAAISAFAILLSTIAS